jgi:ribosomal protein S27AE
MPETPEPRDETVPLSLFHTGRAQCPDCGAALQLVDHLPLVHCNYCGGTAAVERRLRTIEPVISSGFITADAPLDAARRISPSQTIRAVAQDESHCPTCGHEMEDAMAASEIQAIRRCPSCGTQSKIERRLLRSPEADEALAALEASETKRSAKQLDATEKLIDIVEKSTDLATRVKAGYELGEYWSHVNARAAKLLPRVLASCDPRLEIPLAELVGKLLCSDNVILSNAVLRAAEKFTFDVNGSPVLLWQLGLGSGVGLKLLLDTADYASTRGAMEYACSALWAINTMIERNYAGRMRLAEIVLYRLLYLRGPVQAWAIELAKGQLGLGCRFPTKTLLRFIDDCAVERPELIPHIRQCFYHGCATNDGEYLAEFDFIDTLQTWPAKFSAIEQIFPPAPEIGDSAINVCLQKMLGLTSHPQLGPAAIKWICQLIEESPGPRPSIDAMIATHGETLPEEIRRSYLGKYPATPLLKKLPVKYDSLPKPQPTAFDEQLAEWTKLWVKSINQAVDRHHERQRIARAYFEEIKK